ncbi:glutamine synthetase, type I [Desulfofarcimen acetoxidans DSM 771]|uniref:Glutamine synthetase n=1 Tax=Desulfofarcimen acetoxidans (strain ATCC 49208 / DSM 771 / KCTC 5769 / VKM B-1644 / 5575) TaxID=485916 RepID=C8VX74_DESAS|nr:type I glutamate--ammonia ligase [Desulfofarcimen acetoxidans]ACV64470.1 glutamine synthetase, type I [Desulfofarcimen acetoxidans DSM 771]
MDFFIFKLGLRCFVLSLLSKEDVLEKAKEYDVKFIRLQFTDILGSFKNIAITIEELERALNGGIMFDNAVIEGFAQSKQSDIYLCPDPETFVIFPWRPRNGAVARLICDVYGSDGEPFSACPRSVLKRVLLEAERLGYGLRSGAEIEFFMFYMDDQGKPTTVTHDQAGYCDLTPVDLGENARRDMVLTLESMGFEISSSHHEVSAGQHEISLKESDALSMADNLATFKFVVRTIAQRHGLHASFMPKPLAGFNGSGLHLHHSLWKEGENAFHAPSHANCQQLSKTAYYYMGGLLEHARALTAITNPLINSYKRLGLDLAAPVLAGWSEQNRSTMIRVPSQRESGTRIVLRSPDGTCNPYLAMAVTLKAGLVGIISKIKPPAAMEENNLHGGLGKIIKNYGLPSNLNEALCALSANEVIKETLGEQIYSRFIETKEEECKRFNTIIHPWEIEEYLRNY